METKLLLKKIEKIKSNLDVKISNLEREEKDLIVLCEKGLMEIDFSIREVKGLISSHIFDEKAQEIYFFKVLKPSFIALFIYYSKILDWESNKPHAGSKTLKKYFTNKLNLLKSFYDQNLDFYNYYRRNATYLDHLYFVRYRYDLKGKFMLNLHSFDENFTTSQDHFVSQVIANDMLEKYLLKLIDSSSQHDSNDNSPIHWTHPKVSLIELIYALYYSKCFNGGNIELSEVIRHTEKTLNVNLTGFHKTLGEIKARKKERTKFLHLLNENLNQLFLDTDE
ncbi:RteC domain-containing protein [Cloacibacterium sp.]|uniref:RteC domain-containing protein n=1 Tax=Cloacibacterium sp. TaxID=1913682 RepID=UPI0039E6DCE8